MGSQQYGDACIVLFCSTTKPHENAEGIGRPLPSDLIFDKVRVRQFV